MNKEKAKRNYDELEFWPHKVLVDKNITSCWSRTNYLIEKHGFPCGVLMSPKVRLFQASKVRQWMAEREKPGMKSDIGFRRTPRRKTVSTSREN